MEISANVEVGEGQFVDSHTIDKTHSFSGMHSGEQSGSSDENLEPEMQILNSCRTCILE